MNGIDWNDKECIRKMTAWFRQLLRRKFDREPGQYRAKNINHTWTADEDAFLRVSTPSIERLSDHLLECPF